MRTTIDSAGRVVIPKALRDRLGLGGGDDLVIVERDGHIEISPAPTPMSLTDDKDTGVSSAIAEADLPPLTDEDVRAVVEQLRR
ncbi:MAG TPA: AbrB/MazE/SpoVT family DNA-binding domain-containing protein [Actinomycetota bacterium]|nr:AbrB/MazE/SpoVT family DNA-binding domain-containing protein [Actinomycetota bacterium]